MLSRLRGDPRGRPRVDPGLQGGLRAWLEDGAFTLGQALGTLEANGEVGPEEPGTDPGPRSGRQPGMVAWVPPVYLSRARCSALTHQDTGGSLGLGGAGDPSGAAGLGGVGDPSGSLGLDGAEEREEDPWPRIRHRLVTVLFRQWIATGQMGDPWQDAWDGAAAEESLGDPAGSMEAMAGGPERGELGVHARNIKACWPEVPPWWRPRTALRARASLGGGRLVVGSIFDLVLGGPAVSRASVCLVRVVAGERRPVHREERHFDALVETLRAGAAPFRTATFYTATGTMDVESVTEATLGEAAGRVLVALERLAEDRGGGRGEGTDLRRDLALSGDAR